MDQWSEYIQVMFKLLLQIYSLWVKLQESTQIGWKDSAEEESYLWVHVVM